MLTENGSGMVMPVGPMYGNGGSGAFGGWGDGSFWIIVLFLFALMGNGFGNGFGGYGGGTGYVDNSVQRGFDQQAVMSGIGAIQAGINGLAQGQCSGFAGVTGAVTNGFAQAEIANNARQIADMQQNFSIQSALQQCCCDNRAATADLKYTVAQEGAATRANDDAKAQMIMDKLCQLELDGVKQNYENRIAGMQNQIDALQYQVNNADRNVALANEVDALYNRLNSCPVPTTPVYGRTPIFTCGQNQGYGCGCGSAM